MFQLLVYISMSGRKGLVNNFLFFSIFKVGTTVHFLILVHLGVGLKFHYGLSCSHIVGVIWFFLGLISGLCFY